MRHGAILALASLAVVLSSCGRVATIYDRTHHGSRVIVFEKPNTKSLLSVHADPTKVIQIGKLQFEGVRGFGSCFKEIEELQTLVFVTEENGTPFIHAFNLAQNVDRKASLGQASGFGYWLGTTNQENESVTMLNSNALHLSIRGPSYPDRTLTQWDFIFDLERKLVTASGKKKLGR